MTRQAEAELINACCNPPDVCDALRTGRRLDDRFHACRVQSAQVVRYKPGKRCLIKYVGRDAAGTQFAFLGKVRFKGLDRRTPVPQAHSGRRDGKAAGRSACRACAASCPR